MTITDAMIEAGARALCRLRIEHNHRFDKEPRDEAFRKRCEDAAWQDFVVEAKAALEAAERAAWVPEYTARDGARMLVHFPLIRRPRVNWGNVRIGRWAGRSWHLDMPGNCRLDVTLVRPLPTPGEQG